MNATIAPTIEGMGLDMVGTIEAMGFVYGGYLLSAMGLAVSVVILLETFWMIKRAFTKGCKP